MSRFRSLEFDSGSGQRPVPGRDTARDADYYIAEANRAFAEGEFEKALQRFSRALEENPQSAPAWSGQARAFIELERYGEASAWADKALSVVPDDSDVLSAKAVALARQGDPDTAMAISDAGLERQETAGVYPWLSRGEVLLCRGEEAAVFCFEKAQSLSENDWFTLWLIARVRIRQGQHAIALGVLQRALESHAAHFGLWFQRGECEAVLGYVESARVSLRRALELRPGSIEARQALLALDSSGWRRRIAGFWHRLAGR